MTWTAITITPDGEFSYSFSFCGPHDKRAAFDHAQEQTGFEVIAIVSGDHPVYHPDSDE